MPLPTPSQLYGTAHLLLIDVFASYAQRGVRFYRASSSNVSIMLKCLMGHGKHKPRNGETCKMRVQLGRSDGDAEWRFEAEHGQHNHPLGDRADTMNVDGESDALESEHDSDDSDGASEFESDSGDDQKLVHALFADIFPRVRDRALVRIEESCAR